MAWEWTAFMAWVARPAWRVAYLLLTGLVLALVWCSPIHGPALRWALAPIALAWLLMPLRFPVYSRNPDAGRIATPTSEQRVVGNGDVGTCRSWWWQLHKKKK